MRIQSIILRNYRIHRELKVELDSQRTLIGGPNETGKSTLAEAAHRALFLKAKITGDTQKSMVSTIHAGHPEVELCFEAGGRSYRLLKRFSGVSGTALLAEAEGVTLNGEDAESRLAEILGVAAAGGRNAGERVAEQWAHLWVWQGRAGDDPIKHANVQKDDLLVRLQSEGGAVVMQSELDVKTASKFNTDCEAIFTKNGGVRKDSELGRAADELQNSESAQQQAQQTSDKLQQVVRDFEEATSTIKSTEGVLKCLHSQKEVLEAKLTRVAELKSQEALRDQETQTAKENYERLSKEDALIHRLRSELQARSSALEPKNTEAQRFAVIAAEQKSKAQEAEANFQAAGDKVRAVRLRHQLAALHVGLFDKTRQRDEIRVKAEQVRKARSALRDSGEKLAKLPNIDGPKLKALQKLESQCSNAEVALKAMATAVEVVVSKQPVKLGGKKLRAGQPQIITEETEILIGTTTRLHLNPGGGTNLMAARNELQDARGRLQSSLDKFGVGSIGDASEALARRQQLQTQIQAAEARLAGLGADSIDEQLSEADQALTTVTSDVDRRTAIVECFSKPGNLADAKSLAKKLERELDECESDERTSKLVRNKSLEAQTQAEDLLKNAVQLLHDENRAIGELRAQLGLLLETQGEDDIRAKRLSELFRQKRNAETRLAETRNSLAELQPDLLETDRGRLARALECTIAAYNEAKEKHAIARTQLKADGANDPRASLAFADATARSAREHFSSMQRRAKAVQLLHQLFLEEQRSLAEQFTRPLAEKISGYIQCLFGADARVDLTLENNVFAGLQLIRPGQQFGGFEFSSLSGGAREQLGAAVRLAMAELLAQGHDGCLPLVFDDAFAYSDPDRVQTLQRMLDLAAARGLQIIILTCNPSDYAALGAKQVLLHVESSRTKQILTPAPESEPVEFCPEFIDGEPSLRSFALTEEEREMPLSALHHVGQSN